MATINARTYGNPAQFMQREPGDTVDNLEYWWYLRVGIAEITNSIS
jgi:hypothetical protein